MEVDDRSEIISPSDVVEMLPRKRKRITDTAAVPPPSGNSAAEAMPVSDDEQGDEARLREEVEAEFRRGLIYLNDLKPETELTDETLNDYLKLVQQKSDKVWIATTHFKPKLEEVSKTIKTRHDRPRAYSELERFHPKQNKFDALSKCIIPLHLNGNHWACAIVHMDRRPISFEYYDSLQGDVPRQLFKTLRAWIQYKRPKIEVDKVSQVHRIQGPKQINGYDCGVFTAQFIKHYVLNLVRDEFHQADMPRLRKEMLGELQSGSLRPLT